jgi:hypothetical protein
MPLADASGAIAVVSFEIKVVGAEAAQFSIDFALRANIPQ